MRWLKIPFDVPAISIALLSVSGPFVAWLFGVSPGRRALWSAIEVILVLSSLLLVFRYGVIRPYVQGLPRPLQLFLIGFISVMVFAQGISSYRVTFPVMPWTMYEGGTVPPKMVTIYDCVGVGPAGEIALNPSHLFVSNGLGTRRMSNKMIHVLDAAFGDDQPPAIAEQKLQVARDLIRAIGLEHNRTAPSRPIEEVRVTRSLVNWRTSEFPKKEETTVILTVKI